MKNFYNKDMNILNHSFLMILIFILVLSSCAKKTVHIYQEKIKSVFKEKIVNKEVQAKLSIKILSHQAEELVLQGNYQDALLIYNQVYAHGQNQSDEKTKSDIIDKIEDVLSQTPVKDIEQIIETKNMNIPKSLLLYWLSVNYLLVENNAIKAKEILETFLLENPDHTYSLKIDELMKNIRESTFQKNTIGCLLPLTGKFAVFGQRALTGIQLAIKKLSDKYEKQFKIIIIDTKADPEIAANGVKTLYQKNVAGIIGPLLGIEKAGIKAQKFQIPLIALTQKHDFPLLGDYIFSNFITPQMQTETLGAYLFSELGLKKVAILYPDEKYGKKYMELFLDIVEEYNGEIVGIESYDVKKTDFKKPIQKLTKELKDKKNKIGFQALFIPDSPSKINLILPQLAFNDVTDIYLAGTNLWHHKSLLKYAKGYNQNTVLTDGFFNNSQNIAAIEFSVEFQALFKKKPKFLEAISYDTACLLLTFAMDESIDSRQALKETLMGRQIFEGVTGNTIFNENGVARRQLFLMTIQKDRFVEITR